MTYEETITFLFEQLPMYQNIGKEAFKKDLSNITALCEALGNPHKKFKSIHIAGTNGKGSVSHILTSVLMEAGYKVGTYTSPHYKNFTERVKINGKPILRQRVVEFVEIIAAQIETIKPSFFEITVAMAFWYFAKRQVDFALVETGLGGRLDSTNILTPELSIITNIGFDHMNMLGTTLPEIAREKAGIIKPGVPVVLGEWADQNILKVFKKKSRETSSRLLKTKVGKSFDSPLRGAFQKKNIQSAYAAFEVLSESHNLRVEHFIRGLKNINKNCRIIGRWQVIGDKPLTILDSAHNLPGIRSLLTEILDMVEGELHLVYGTVADKDLTKILHLFPVEARYYLTEPNVVRKLPVEELEKNFRDFDLVQSFSKPAYALKAARKAASHNDIILAFGSIFLIADLLPN